MRTFPFALRLLLLTATLGVSDLAAAPQSTRWAGRHRQALAFAGARSATEVSFYRSLAGRRQAHGLGRQSECSILEMAAERRLRDMQQRRYFGHYGPRGRGSAYLKAAMSYGHSMSECLAFGTRMTPEQAVGALLRSPKHRASLLGDWRKVGVAVGPLSCEHGEGTAYVVLFGDY